VSAPLLFPLPGNERLAAGLAPFLRAEVGALTVRRFPDGESYVRLETAAGGRDVVLVCTLDRPDDKILPLVFVAAAAAELGARRVGLITPYLAYMRQDRRFQEGEGITSAYFARVLSSAVDWIVTVDPHLHRRTTLSEIYSIPTRVVHAAPFVAAWIRAHVERPLLVGPDAESDQWVRAVAEKAEVPHMVLEKVRRGDRDVRVSVPEVERWRDHTPVLIDDIISTARTMIETVAHLRRAGMAPPVCVGVHGIFAEGAEEGLRAAGAARIVTSNTIPHPTNTIDLTPLIAEACADPTFLNTARMRDAGSTAAEPRERQGQDFEQERR
jgi:ribose-phosphate pyrophosphokinase